MRLPYLDYYENLLHTYHSAAQCENNLKSEIFNTWKQRITNAHMNDPDSKLGTYLEINPKLESPLYADNLFEIERIHISRFRTGSHNLLIETGRFTNPRMPRESRLCSCGDRIQTIHHVLMECSIVLNSINNNNLRNTF